MTHDSCIFIPSDACEKLIFKSIWRIQRTYQEPRIETILPKGTVELIFNFSSQIQYLPSNGRMPFALPYCFLNGVNFSPFRLIKEDHQDFLGVQLSQIGLKCVMDVCVQEFNDQVIDGALVCKSLLTLHEQLIQAESFSTQVEILRAWLRLKVLQSQHASRLKRINDLFSRSDYSLFSVNKLCTESGLSARQLRRLSLDWLGMNTETFILYNKYLCALQLLHNSEKSLSQIGLESGYYDQPHFIREFKAFTGITPKTYQAASKEIAGHIVGA